jgi:hypothetical protein
MKKTLAALVFSMILLCANGCARETSPGSSEWCLKYDPVVCSPNDMDCLSNEAEYLCLCEKKSHPTLYKELCE